MIRQTPWIQRSFDFNFQVTHFPVIFSRLEGTLFRLQAILINADDEYCSYNANGWSVKRKNDNKGLGNAEGIRDCQTFY